MRKTGGFTLVEVLVATTIVSIVIVGSFLLLSSANRQWDRIGLEKNTEEVELSVRACIWSFPFSYIKSITGSGPVAVNFWSDNLSCATGSYDTSLSFTGISLYTYLGTWDISQTRGAALNYQAFFSVSNSADGNASERLITQKIISTTGERTLEWSRFWE